MPPVTEPKAVATEIEEIAPSVWHWSVHNEAIDFISSAHAVRGDGGTVLIDPVRLAPEPISQLGDAEAICLTTSGHQRSAWRYRRELGAKVYAPELVTEVEEEPDVRYSDGDRLPGGLLAVFTPGAGTRQHSLLLEREGGVLFTPDLFVHPPGGPLMMIDARYAHDVEEARRTAEKLLELDFSMLCTGHGGPIVEDPKGAIRAALSG
jgi:glyoxylase-like metal-dependent hydrolase (beta-lactamase superfamily II)